jgi:hypothetical protein
VNRSRHGGVHRVGFLRLEHRLVRGYLWDIRSNLDELPLSSSDPTKYVGFSGYRSEQLIRWEQ